jgi:hypothetical protein
MCDKGQKPGADSSDGADDDDDATAAADADAAQDEAKRTKRPWDMSKACCVCAETLLRHADACRGAGVRQLGAGVGAGAGAAWVATARAISADALPQRRLRACGTRCRV